VKESLMKLKIPSLLRRKAVEFLSSMAMIAAGVYFSSTGATGSRVVLAGNLLSALGGVLLSWSAARLSSKESAADILRPQLSAVARQLVTVSGQISKSVNDARSGELDPAVALEMISQAARIMYTSVNEIHVVLNQRVESQELLETAQRVEELATQLAGSAPHEQDEVESELKDAVADLRDKIRNIESRTGGLQLKAKDIPKARPEDLESVTVPCPGCNETVSLSIGKAFASSAMGKCASCGMPFHAHRGQDGSVFTKVPGRAFPGYERPSP
jgi:hypothetical protein